jgi:hypothetical protein
VPATFVKDVEKRVNTNFAKVGKTVKEMEGFLSKFSSVMLPTTSYAVQVKYALIQLLPLDDADEKGKSFVIMMQKDIFKR